MKNRIMFIIVLILILILPLVYIIGLKMNSFLTGFYPLSVGFTWLSIYLWFGSKIEMIISFSISEALNLQSATFMRGTAAATFTYP